MDVKHFEYEHLIGSRREAAKVCADTAQILKSILKEGDSKANAVVLRKLLEAKDAALHSAYQRRLPSQPAGGS